MEGNAVIIICLSLGGFSLADELRFPESESFRPALIELNGYILERHYVTTPDGCILEMHRTWHHLHRLDETSPRPVVFLMHGLFGSSQNFMHLGPKYAIGYNLASVGLDVWMGNARGSSPSRHHIKLNPQVLAHRLKYFDFGFDEISNYDLPAMLDYTLNYTHSDSLHYVSYSYAGHYLFILLSMKPQYLKHIKTLHFLGYTVSMEKLHPIVESAIEYLKELYRKGIENHIYELYASDFNDTNKMERMCKSKRGYQCMRELRTLVNELAASEFRHEAAPTKLLSHLGRILEHRQIISWDYGPLGNLAVYGGLDRHTHNASVMHVPISIYYSDKDVFINRMDAITSRDVLLNAKVIRIADPNFVHTDYFLKTNVKQLVTKHMIKTILSHEETLKMKNFYESAEA